MTNCPICKEYGLQSGCLECLHSLMYKKSWFNWDTLKTGLDCLAIGGLNGILVQHLNFGVFHTIGFVLCSTWILTCIVRGR